MQEKKTMLITLSTEKTVSEVAAALQAAVPAHHFGIMQVYNFKEILAKKEVEFSRECMVFEVCQPAQAKRLLDQNMSLSNILPCRISLYEQEGKTILELLTPTTLVALFKESQLAGVAEEIEETLVAIMKKAISA
jgi:uncharacterized protein (DUF302 family)